MGPTLAQGEDTSEWRTESQRGASFDHLLTLLSKAGAARAALELAKVRSTAAEQRILQAPLERNERSERSLAKVAHCALPKP